MVTKLQASRLRILVGGYIVRGPLGGLAWHHLQYVLALHQMGHDVVFMEDSDNYPSCFNPDTCAVNQDPSYGLKFIESSFRRLGLENQWAFYDAHSTTWHGRTEGSIVKFIASADLFLNLSGMTRWRSWFEHIPRRVYVDTDPVFTQLRLMREPAEHTEAASHTHFYTFAGNMGAEDCCLPDDGFPWLPTRQPVVLDQWRSGSTVHHVTSGEPIKLTTIMQWDSYEPQTYRGNTYGMKSLSFDSVLALPVHTEATAQFELAMGSSTAPIAELQELNWSIVSSLGVTRTIDTYRSYLHQSDAEFSVAKHGYVVSRSGWFSERSINYMASGKPVIVQDTGFSTWLPTGTGVLGFSDLDGAVAAVADLLENPTVHQSAARELAEQYFSPEVVLAPLLDDVMRVSRDADSPTRLIA